MDGGPGKPHFLGILALAVGFWRLTKCAKIWKALIPLHFSNPKLHNKLLASRHPNMG
jgi:hypothetical protein